MKDTRSLDLPQKAIALLLTLASCFGILIPVAGFAYYLGYLGAFGLDTDSFPLSLWDLWKNCVYVIVEIVLIAPKYLAILLILILGLLIGFIYSLLLHSFASSLDDMGLIPKFMKMEIKPSLDVDRVSHLFLVSSKFSLAIFVAVILLLISFFVFSGLAFLGGMNGKKHLTSYQASGCSGNGLKYCVTYSSPNTPESKSYNGLLFAASSTHIAIFDGGDVSVIPRTPEYVLTRTISASAQPR